MVYRADLYTIFGPKADNLWVRSSALDIECEYRCLHACMHVVYRADLCTVFRPKADIWVRSSALDCVCVCVCMCVTNYMYLHKFSLNY